MDAILKAIARDHARARIGERVVVASVSGGKDSAALSLLLKEWEIPHRRVFMDTGWEHEKTYEYLRGELTRVVGPIEEIRGPRQMEELILHKGTFPSRVIRFCTQELKIFPMQKYLASVEGAEPINAVGIRHAESEARAKMPMWEWSASFDCEVWRPLVHWSEADVVAIHKRHGLRPNPLYLLGAMRVGCWPCIFARKAEIRLIAERDPTRIDRLRRLEASVTELAEQRYERRGESFESRGLLHRAWFQSKSKAEGGATWPIDRVVEWSKTSHGGKEFEPFVDDQSGCMRWGMCETEGQAAVGAAPTEAPSGEKEKKKK